MSQLRLRGEGRARRGVLLVVGGPGEVVLWCPPKSLSGCLYHGLCPAWPEPAGQGAG